VSKVICLEILDGEDRAYRKCRVELVDVSCNGDSQWTKNDQLCVRRGRLLSEGVIAQAKTARKEQMSALVLVI
jgi:hypothetical protein